MAATFGGHIDAVSKLLKAGARTDLRDARGATAADWAKRLGHTEIRQLLLGHGAVGLGERGTSGNAPKAHAQVEGAAESMKVEELAPVE